MRLGFLLLGGVFALTVACATGVDTDDAPFDALSTSGSGEAGYGGYGGDDSSSTHSGMGGGMGGMGGDEMGGMGGMAPGCLYDSPNNCQSANSMPAIAGDESSPTVTERGQTSKWFVIHVEERVSSIFDEDLSYTVTLQNPANMDFDLFVLPGPQDGNPDCNANPLPGNVSGNVETVHQSWDDDQGLGGEDDSRWLCIEVRYVSGMECGSAAEWTLTVEGDT